MAKPRKKPVRSGDRHTSPREAFYMPPELRQALQTCADSSDPPATKTAVMIAALQAYLAARGHWPPKD